MMLMFIITENIYDNLLQPAKVVWQRNKTIISILFTQYAKYPNTKINANVTQLNENVQIKFGINANELIRNLFVFWHYLWKLILDPVF